MMKKYIGFISAALFLASVLPTLASENFNVPNLQQIVNINPSGGAVLSGKLKSKNLDSLVISSWGGDWVITIASTTKITKRTDGKVNLSDLLAGDMLQITGKVNTTSPWTVNARAVKDTSFQTRTVNLNGTISNLKSDSFTLTTKKDGAIQVTFSTSTKVLIGNFSVASTTLMNGFSVSVSGVLSTQTTTFIADKIRLERKEVEKEKKDEYKGNR
jgi:hypothetical protein